MPEINSATELSPVKRALAEIRRLRVRLDELESGSAEPVAIVGLGLRLPGDVKDEESFWNLLAAGHDPIGEIPRDRWDWRDYFDLDKAAPGTAVTRFGGFIDHPEEFDATFFGIAPREATMMDPQHRLVLEIAWEALENAGFAASGLQDGDTGIFLGIGNNDYARQTMRNQDEIDAYVGSGNSPAMVAGRLSYILGLHGPSQAIDTSCSSSLVAVHLACASIRSGECRIALAGGVNLMLLPDVHIALSRAQMMAPDGRCKTFDDSANGYVRSEGGCIVVLKKLSAAVEDRDRILAVIRGSAVNHDGRSGGLTAPSGPAQVEVIRKALESARIDASEVGFVETHGTGTALGDPIEVEALASVFADGRDPEQALLLGALKTNLGHLESASGIVGLVKAALVLQHGIVPANLHLKKKNTRIPWDRLNVSVPAKNTSWNGRYAGVSSFGFSGTNAHVILERAPETLPHENVPERPWHVLALSAKSEVALDNLRRSYAQVLRTTNNSIEDVCFTANSGRSHFPHRVALVAQTAKEFADGLEGAATIRSFSGEIESEAGRVGFLFTGQGSQYAGMGAELYEGSSVFRESVERCSAEWKEQGGESLIEALYVRGEELSDARVIQPALFAVEYGLAELWRSWGIEPGLVLGHSLGEYVGAVVAGLLNLGDGLRLVGARAELMEKLSERGTMRAVLSDAETVQGALAGWESEVAIAAINGPTSVVISGSTEGVRAVSEKLEGEGLRTRALEVSHGFHSPVLEPILDEFEARAGAVAYGQPRVRMVSNLTGRTAGREEMGRAGYWRDHMRQTVQFHAGLQTALASGYTTFIEIGPQPHLRAIATKTDASLADRIKVSMAGNRSAFQQMCESVAQLYVEGQPVNWSGFDRGYRRSRVVLPTYPFERQRYWQGPNADEIARGVWQRASDAAAAQAQFAPVGTNVEQFPKKWDALKNLTIAQILVTLGELGVLREGGIHEPDTLIRNAGVIEAHQRLMRRWWSMLVEEGYLQQSGHQVVIPSQIVAPDLTLAWQNAEAQLHDDPYLLAYLRNCATLLRQVLLGQASPLETLFPGSSPELAMNLYEKSTGARYANAIVGAAVEAAAVSKPAGGMLRILEIGAGTGSATASVLPRLPLHGISYLFTDVSDQFLQKASVRFARYPYMRYAILDIENEAHMRARRNSCDVLIASNVVHATRDIQKTLEQVRQLVVPGGTVILLETTQSLAWHEITTGLIEGWQKSDDTLRSGATLMNTSAWRDALQAAGFAAIAQAPKSDSPAEAVGLHVLLAQAPSGVVSPGDSAIPEEEFLRHSVALANGVPPVSSGPVLKDQLVQIPEAERRGIVLEAVKEEVAHVLRLSSPEQVRKRDRLMEIGVDSLMALELSRRLAERAGLADMPSTLMFDYPTPEAIADYILRRLGPGEGMPNNMEAESAQDDKLQLPQREADEMSDEEMVELLRQRLER